MNNQSVTFAPTGDRPVPTSQTVFTATLFQALFWKPRFTAAGPALAHVPMLFWLTAALREGRTAVLGCDDGIIQFALCQALEKLVPDGKCRGYGYWNNPKSGKLSSNVPGKLRAHEGMLYEGISRIRAGVPLSEAIDEIINEPVDLLCVDLEALPVDASVNAEALLSAIASNGALVLHGTNGMAQRPHDGRSLQRVVQSSRSVEFESDKGAILIVKGESTQPPLQSLLDSAKGGKPHWEIEAVFRRSGYGLLAGAKAAVLTEARSRVEKDLAHTQAALSEARTSLLALQQGLHTRSRKIVDLQAELFDLRQKRTSDEENSRSDPTQDAELQSLREELAHIRANAVDTTADLVRKYEYSLVQGGLAREQADEERKKRLEEVAELASTQEQALADLKHAQEQVKAERKIRIDEVGELTRISEEWRARSSSYKTASATLNQAFADLQGELGPLRAERVERDRKRAQLVGVAEKLRTQNGEIKADAWKLRKQLKRAQKESHSWQGRVTACETDVSELLASTSWKITRPIRWVKSAWRRRS